MSYSTDAGADDLLRLWHETLLPRRYSGNNYVATKLLRSHPQRLA